jgi:hypothetical protein
VNWIQSVACIIVELEFFRTQHRHREVGEQGECDESGENGLHGRGWLQAFAPVDVVRGEDEEGGGDTEVDEIVHNDLIICAAAWKG